MRSTMMDFPLTVRHIFWHGRTTYADSEVVTNEAEGVRRGQKRQGEGRSARLK